MSQIIGSIVKQSNVSFILRGDSGKLQTFNIAEGHPNFRLIKDKVVAGDPTELDVLANVAQSITKWGVGRVTVEFGVIKYNGLAVHNSLTSRILSMIDDGHDASKLLKFLDNVQTNPLESARQDLYDFLEGNNLPITENGKFLAYKRIGDDFKDLYTHTMDNSPGKVVEMERSKVDTNRNNTCSRGLHFASLEYARDCYGNSSKDRMVVVEIDPADVVSIPTDYNRQKGRTWKYTVIGEISLATLHDEDLLESQTVIDNSQWDKNQSYEDFLRGKAKKQRRDANGRFVA